MKKKFETAQPVFIKTGGKCIVVRIEELVFVKVEKHYICMFFKNQEKPYKVKASLAEVAAVLPKGLMISPSRSCLVNINEVRSFDKDYVWVEICGKPYHFSVTNPHFELYFSDIFGDNPFHNQEK